MNIQYAQQRDERDEVYEGDSGEIFATKEFRLATGELNRVKSLQEELETDGWL